MLHAGLRGDLFALFIHKILQKKKQFNAIKLKYLVKWYKPQVTCTQQHPTYMFQTVIY